MPGICVATHERAVLGGSHVGPTVLATRKLPALTVMCSSVVHVPSMGATAY